MSDRKENKNKELGAELSRRSKVDASGIKWVTDEGNFYSSESTEVVISIFT